MIAPNCHGCILEASPKVFGEFKGAKILIVGGYPDSQSATYSRPYATGPGEILQDALIAAGINRGMVDLTTIIACSPVKDSLGQTREAEKKRGGDSCIVRCRPRMDSVAKDYTQIIAMGNSAISHFRGRKEKLEDIRGTGEEIGGRRIFFTEDPNVIHKTGKGLSSFVLDICKAVRWFQGKLDQRPILVERFRDPEAWLAKVKTLNDPAVFDFETTIDHPLNCIPCVLGMGDEERSYVLEIRDRRTLDWVATKPKDLLVGAVREAFDSKSRWYGHNGASFDYQVAYQQLGIEIHARDTMLQHVLGYSEERHGLGVVVSTLTDNMTPWKADHTATKNAPIEELAHYCGQDCVRNARVVRSLEQRLAATSQEHLAAREDLLARIGATMQRNGMFVRRDVIDRIRKEQTEKSAILKAELLKYESVNPGSSAQLSKLLYDKWKIPATVLSKETGNPATSEDALVDMLIGGALNPVQKQYIRTLRKWRKSSKLASTYLDSILKQMLGDRIHGGFSRLPVTGRYNSTNPNMQNWPKDMRAMIGAKKGHVFLSADADQLEARIIAEETGARTLWRCIREGLSIHNETMEVIFGSGIWQLPGAPKDKTKKGKDVFADRYLLAKRARYLRQYGGQARKMLEVLRKIEDKEKGFLYANLVRSQVEEMIRGLDAADPEIPEFWTKILNQLERHGYVQDSFWGRRRYLPRFAKPNKALNFPIQAGGAVVMNEAIIELFQGYASDWFVTESMHESGEKFEEASRYLTGQVHDQIILEVPEKDADKWTQRLNYCMNRRRKDAFLRGPIMEYTAEASVTDTWKDG